MTIAETPRRHLMAIAALTLALVAGVSAPALAQIHCFPDSVLPFPRIATCAFPGRWQDSSLVQPYYCVGRFRGPLPDSIRPDDRVVSLRFKRDRRAEARPDFGGYRVYRAVNFPDTSQMVLLRRYSLNSDSTLSLFNFSRVNTAPGPNYLQFMCQGGIANDSIVTFVDPDSSGSFQKKCRNYDSAGNCVPRGDSIMVRVVPPGPHDGFRIWYSVTYEALNTQENTFEDLFVPDTLTDNTLTPAQRYIRCGVVGVPSSCPNANNKAANMTSVYVEPTGGPTQNLETVGVVPNPYRASAPWDPAGGNELHFVNLPQRATIRIFTVAGDKVATLEHNDPVRDFERWNLENDRGNPVASGIYLYEVVSGSFTFRSRFIVIR